VAQSRLGLVLGELSAHPISRASYLLAEWNSPLATILFGPSRGTCDTPFLFCLAKRKNRADECMTRSEPTQEEPMLREQRFRAMVDTAPVLLSISGTKLCTYFNKPWLDFTWRSTEEELGNGWAEGVHAEDQQRCLLTYAESFDPRETFHMDYRLRRHEPSRALAWSAAHNPSTGIGSNQGQGSIRLTPLAGMVRRSRRNGARAAS